MTVFVGNCNHLIDWETIVTSLNSRVPAYTGPRHRNTDDIDGIVDIATKWNNAEYSLVNEGGSAGWGMYFANQHFEQEVVDIFARFVGISPVNAWISKISPGQIAPWHWDANDAEREYATMPDMLRFSCHISKPTPGHVTVIEDVCLYGQAQGNTYKWPSRKSWHAGGNFGVVPKYLFNMFGHKL
jgi:hypothetical protein